MLLVIFGAGASYDSSPTYPLTISREGFPMGERLPLADQLFQNRASFNVLLEKFPKCHPIVPYLRRLPANTTLEHVLEGLQKEAATDPDRLKQLLTVRSYLQVLILGCEEAWNDKVTKGVTNYKTLLDQIRTARKHGEQVCLVTFNYDTMIDSAMPTVGVHIDGLDSYIANANYKLIKVHGSVNWAREVGISAVENQFSDAFESLAWVIERASELKPKTIQYVKRSWTMPICRIESQFALPALAIPVETKTESHFECPPEHLDALRSFLPKVTKILIIGWRATESHFLKLLQDNLKKTAMEVMVVAGKKEWAEDVCVNLRKGVNFTSIKAEHGLTEFILNREGEEFLKK